jgi:hypothetical protein
MAPYTRMSITDAKLSIFENAIAGDTGHENRITLTAVTLSACSTANIAAPARCAATAFAG